MTEEIKDPQKRTVELLEELLKWLKMSIRPTIKKTFEENIKTDTEKLVYELSNGNSSPFIAKKAGIDSSTVRDYWQKWAEKGMMEICSDYKRRYCRVLSLKELGIEVPDTENSIVKTKSDEYE